MVCVTPQATFQMSFDNNASTDLGTFSSPFSPCPSIPVVPSPHMYKSQESKHKQTRLTTNSNMYLLWLLTGFAQIFGSKIQDFFRLFSRTWKEFDSTTGKALAEALKKILDFLPFFQTLSLFSRLFLGVENCFANFKTFPRIPYEPLAIIIMGHYRCRNTFIVWFTTRPKHRHRNLGDKGNKYWESTYCR